ncbi:Holliday junction branch migration protein RuvA [Candidatus Saccharibacteria bacterium]|nr:Holliday junction branch migration protein RuvA [Candidatus Saccharibacteria bacterium]
MIAHVSGVVAEKFINSVIVDVQGIGYEVQVPLYDAEKVVLGEEVKLYTYHHIREQSQELFGFSSLVAKKLFELLITVQGVGPKAGLAILSLSSSEEVRNAIASGDSGFISKASGVGKKIAERVVVDLSDKVGLAVSVAQSSGSSVVMAGDEALEALMALGYTLADATAALESVPKNGSTADRVRMALRG